MVNDVRYKDIHSLPISSSPFIPEAAKLKFTVQVLSVTMAGNVLWKEAVLVNLTRAEVIWEKGASTEEMWPLGKPVRYFLD